MSVFNILLSNPVLALLGLLTLAQEDEMRKEGRPLSEILLNRYYALCDSYMDRIANTYEVSDGLADARMQIFNAWVYENQAMLDDLERSNEIYSFTIPENIYDKDGIAFGKVLKHTANAINKAFRFGEEYKPIRLEPKDMTMYAAPEIRLSSSVPQQELNQIDRDDMDGITRTEYFYAIFFLPECYDESIYAQSTDKRDREMKEFLEAHGVSAHIFLLSRPYDKLIHFLFYVYMWCKEEYKYIWPDKPVPSFNGFTALFELSILEDPQVVDGGLSGY